jgi:hypothetical protein
MTLVYVHFKPKGAFTSVPSEDINLPPKVNNGNSETYRTAVGVVPKVY